MKQTVDAFTLAHAFTSKWEGGLVDHPSDPGGITNFGISFRFLKDYAERNAEWLQIKGIQLPITADTIRQLTEEQAEHLYRRAFWVPSKAEDMLLLPAVAHYDFAVNAGLKQAARTLQTIVEVPVDGIIGAGTLEALCQLCEDQGQDRVAEKLCVARQYYYSHLARINSKYQVFLKGWTNRVNALKLYLKGL